MLRRSLPFHGGAVWSGCALTEGFAVPAMLVGVTVGDWLPDEPWALEASESSHCAVPVGSKMQLMVLSRPLP